MQLIILTLVANPVCAGVTLDDVCIAHAFDLTLRADGYGLAAKGQVAGRIVVDHAGQIVGACIKLQDIKGIRVAAGKRRTVITQIGPAVL